MIRPHRNPALPLPPAVWLTDIDLYRDPLAKPEVVGFNPFPCVRWAVRYVVPADVPITWWPKLRGTLPPMLLHDLESYGWPSRWWLTFDSFPADPTPEMVPDQAVSASLSWSAHRADRSKG